MTLFGKKKQKLLLPPDAVRSVQVLGASCKNCRALYESARAAVQKMGLDVEVEHITDVEKAAAYSILHTPALVVNGKVVSMGRVLSSSEAENRIRRAVQ